MRLIMSKRGKMLIVLLLSMVATHVSCSPLLTCAVYVLVFKVVNSVDMNEYFYLYA